MKILARLSRVGGWLSIEREVDFAEAPSQGSFISIDDMTPDELSTLGFPRDGARVGRRFEVVLLRFLNLRKGPAHGVELYCLFRTDAEIAAKRADVEPAEASREVGAPHDRLAAFFREFGRSP